MKDRRPAIEITIENSVVQGDVVAGDKTVNVHLHEDRLTSVAEVTAALLEQGLKESAVDHLIQEILKKPDLRARFDAAKKKFDAAQIEKLLGDTIREYERSGSSPEMIETLWSTVERSRREEDWSSLSKAGTAFLTLTHNNIPEAQKRGITLAEELVAVGRKNTDFQRNIPIARGYQARYLYLEYTNAVLELRTALAMREHLPIKLPLINLVVEHKKALGYLTLSDEYARQALDVAFDLAQPDLVIYTLFNIISIQEHAHFHHRYSLGADARDLAERVFRSYRVLEQMIDAFATDSERGLLYSNMANFWLQTEDFEKAEHLALAAAKKLAAVGDAHGASRAMDVAGRARSRELVFRPPPPDLDLEALPLEKVEAALRETSARLIRLHGMDPDEPRLQEVVETAWKDFNPERVLRHCVFLVADCEPSPLANTVGIPTLGQKRLTCEKLGRTVQGATLDGTFEFFKTRLGCDICPHHTPRPPEWKWSLKWSSEDAKRRSGAASAAGWM